MFGACAIAASYESGSAPYWPNGRHPRTSIAGLHAVYNFLIFDAERAE